MTPHSNILFALVLCLTLVQQCDSEPLISQCKELFYEQPFDHFSFDTSDSAYFNLPSKTFKQRYFICSYDTWKSGGPVFFYTGNEADVTLYLNSTGLMWENAKEFGALLVFAEHRYFGESLLPTSLNKDDNLRYLSATQVVEDYAELIAYLRTSVNGINKKTPFVAFGGSYGGMLASWLRMKHPESVVGAVAASAPILAFLGLEPEYDAGGYALIETEDAGTKCSDLVRKAFKQMVQLGQTQDGRATIAQKLKLCSVPQSMDEVIDVVRPWAGNAIGYLAMGNLPYRSTYITNGRCEMPEWPLVLGCTNAQQSHSNDPLSALQDVISVFYNCSQTFACLNTSGSVNNETQWYAYLWQYLACTELLMPSSTDGVKDMFWSEPWDLDAYTKMCTEMFPGVMPRPYNPSLRFGGYQALRWATNIVFSNGSLDPWRAGGVQTLPQGTSETVKVIIIDKGAHHVDLMFSNANDLPSFVEARKTELASIRSWINTAV